MLRRLLIHVIIIHQVSDRVGERTFSLLSYKFAHRRVKSLSESFKSTYPRTDIFSQDNAAYRRLAYPRQSP